jgi:hypothetical protein
MSELCQFGSDSYVFLYTHTAKVPIKCERKKLGAYDLGKADDQGPDQSDDSEKRVTEMEQDHRERKHWANEYAQKDQE